MSLASLRALAESAADRGRPVGGLSGETVAALLDVADAMHAVDLTCRVPMGRGSTSDYVMRPTRCGSCGHCRAWSSLARLREVAP